MTEPHPRRSALRDHALACVAGALFPLGLAPVDHAWLIPLSAGLLAWLLRDTTPRTAALRGAAFGIGFWGVGASWVYVSIHQFGGTPLPLAVALTALFVLGLSLFHALQGFVYSALGLQRHEVMTFPALWVIFEWVRVWFLSGFPWLFAGYGIIDTPLSGYLPLVGVLGGSGLVVFCGVLILQLIRTPARSRWIALTVLTSIATGGWLLTGHRWTLEDTTGGLTVALVQGNIPQELKWLPEHRQGIIDTYTSLSEPLWGQTDVVIWPEAALPLFYIDALPVIEHLDQQAKSTGTAFVSGIPYWEPGGPERKARYYNSIFASGQGSGLYHKQTLVPFGEYVPLEDWIRGLIPFFNLPLSSFTAGDANQSPLIAKGFALAPYICYEIVYPELVRAMSKQSDVLLTISNDAWFGDSFGPVQHYQMARVRALELGRYLLRVTNTGITGIIDPLGRVMAEHPRGEAGVLRGTVTRMLGQTPYSRWGYHPLLVLCFLVLGLSLLLKRRYPSP